MKSKLKYQGRLIIPDFLMMLPLKDEVKQKHGITNQGFAIVMAQLLRRAECVNSDTITITSSFLSNWTGYKVWNIDRYLKVMRELGFIKWESKNDRKPRAITINYDLLNKMSSKYDETKPIEKPEAETEIESSVDVQKPVSDVDIINSIVNFLVEKGTIIDFEYVDEIRDTLCGGDDKLRRKCTLAAKQIIKEKKLLNEATK